MVKKVTTKETVVASRLKPSALLDTRVVYCGDNLEQLAKLPDVCVDLIYIDPPFNSNRNYEVFWGETKEKRAFEDRRENTKAYIDYMRPRYVQLARVLKQDRRLLLPLRLARQPLHQGDVRPDVRRK
jgi:16S rRNA G966 N2-methylase RsmD